jgi:hypothetical protein
MGEMPRLPCVILLSLNVEPEGHSFGASLFRVLRMCSSVRKLVLAFDVSTEQLEVILHPSKDIWSICISFLDTPSLECYLTWFALQVLKK